MTVDPGVAHGGLVAGDAVVYQAPYPGAPVEDGVVTSLSSDPTSVFVRYRGGHPSAPGKSTRVVDLRRPH